MKEYPISMNDEMARATLEQRKTQARRVITSRNSLFDGGPWPNNIKHRDLDWHCAYRDLGPSPAGNKGPYLHVQHIEENTWHRIYPKIQIGDRLWVRETWAILALHVSIDQAGISYRADGELNPDAVIYPRFLPKEKRLQAERWFSKGRKWRPSIFMPRWASRILLEITNLRVERVQNISMRDAIAESAPTLKGCPDPRVYFHDLWDEINAKRGYPWSSNPWVLVVEFKVLEPEHDSN